MYRPSVFIFSAYTHSVAFHSPGFCALHASEYVSICLSHTRSGIPLTCVRVLRVDFIFPYVSLTVVLDSYIAHLRFHCCKSVSHSLYRCGYPRFLFFRLTVVVYTRIHVHVLCM